LLGAVFANLIGTIGASMLLIQPTIPVLKATSPASLGKAEQRAGKGSAVFEHELRALAQHLGSPPSR
jgi:hypothetical protein